MINKSMTVDDFKVGTIFQYQYIGQELIDAQNANRALVGIGKITAVDQTSNKAYIEWLWHPICDEWTKGDWYSISSIEVGWIHRCKVINEKEKLSLLLKYTFG